MGVCNWEIGGVASSRLWREIIGGVSLVITVSWADFTRDIAVLGRAPLNTEVAHQFIEVDIGSVKAWASRKRP